ncbi:MAG: BolA family transcriptional regulator [Alphaproteobacteria bacterium]|nr:BolA family transcriptional regulator [Alphaproteobacteria bacterium]
MHLTHQIEEKLTREFSPLFLKVEDLSYRHIDHGNYRAGGESHLTVTLMSKSFTDLPRLRRHQQVYACLQEELKSGIHALCLKLFSPEEGAALSE